MKSFTTFIELISSDFLHFVLYFLLSISLAHAHQLIFFELLFELFLSHMIVLTKPALHLTLGLFLELNQFSFTILVCNSVVLFCQDLSVVYIEFAFFGGIF